MNRDPIQRMREETRYTRTNPPVNADAAQERVEKLNGDILCIETDLEHTALESFVERSAYELWRKRAISALGYKKTELKFVESWLKSWQKKCASEQSQASHDKGLQILKGRIVAALLKIHEKYGPSISYKNPPATLEDAKQRATVLFNLRGEIEAEFVWIKGLRIKHGLTEREIREARKPLQNILHTIVEENRYVREYLRLHDPDHHANEPLSEVAKEVAVLADTLANEIAEECPPAYSAENPARDIEEARQRLKTISGIRFKIEQAVKRVNSAWQDQPYSGGTLQSARQPLMDLRRSVDMEGEYLTTFIHERAEQIKRARFDAELAEVKVGNDELQRDPFEQDQSILEIRKRADELAQEIGQGYTPLYTVENPPMNLDEAKRRMATVAETRSKVQSALREVTDAWYGLPLRQHGQRLIKRPFVVILEAVEEETRVIKKFIIQSGGEVMSMKRRWSSICATALTRAVMAGFKLTIEEQEAVQKILSDMIASSDAKSR